MRGGAGLTRDPKWMHSTGGLGMLLALVGTLAFLWLFRVYAQWSAISLTGSAPFSPAQFREAFPALTRFLTWIEVDPFAPADTEQFTARSGEVLHALYLRFALCFTLVFAGLGVFFRAFLLPGVLMDGLRFLGSLLLLAGLVTAGVGGYLMLTHTRTVPRLAFLDERDVLLHEYLYGDLSAMLTLPHKPDGEVVAPGESRDMHLVVARPPILMLDSVLHTPGTLQEALPTLVARRESVRLFLWEDRSADPTEMVSKLEAAGFPRHRVWRVALDDDDHPRAHPYSE